MESFVSRFRNVLALVIVLAVQVVALAVQVKRPADPQRPDGPTVRLVRVWMVTMLMPFEKGFSYTGSGIRNSWRNYIALRDARRENEQLKEELEKMRLEQVRLSEDASQARRLQALLAFKEQFIAKTVAAQVIGGSGTDRSRVLYIDKGKNDGIEADMAVITPDGVVGKISRVLPGQSQVLLINDSRSGAGVMLGSSRLRGILAGTGGPFPEVHNIMADEKVEKGEPVLTSGGDQIFPRGLPVGRVEQVGMDNTGDPFFLIKVRPAADLGRLEEVLVITHMEERQSENADDTPRRAADILAERLPTAKPNPQNRVSDEPPPTSQLYGPGAKKKKPEEPPDTRILYGTDAHPRNTTGGTPTGQQGTAKPNAPGGPAGGSRANPGAAGSNASSAPNMPNGTKPAEQKPAVAPKPKQAAPAATKPPETPPPGAGQDPR